MRISGGAFKDVRLRVPPGARPAAEHVRRALFSSLGGHVDGARVLDLYCGSGAYGLEALSRGASAAVFVDSDARAVAAVRHNAAACGVPVVAHRRDAVRYAAGEAVREGPFDLVFCDPPYGSGAGVGALVAGLAAALRPGGLAVVEQRWSADAPPAASEYVLRADRRYGDTRLLVYRRDGSEATADPTPQTVEDE